MSLDILEQVEITIARKNMKKYPCLYRYSIVDSGGQWRSISARSNSIKTRKDPIRGSSWDGY